MQKVEGSSPFIRLKNRCKIGTFRASRRIHEATVRHAEGRGFEALHPFSGNSLQNGWFLKRPVRASCPRRRLFVAGSGFVPETRGLCALAVEDRARTGERAPERLLVPAIQFIGDDGYPSHGSPRTCAGKCPAHIHISWMSGCYGSSSLAPPCGWVGAFPGPSPYATLDGLAEQPRAIATSEHARAPASFRRRAGGRPGVRT
jgi:hypothetical protein